MTDHPILFSAPMVRALLEGGKTQTRRVLKPQPDTTSDPSEFGCWGCLNRYGYWYPVEEARPYATGDRLWVREAHALVTSSAYRMSAGVEQAINPKDKYQAAIYREGFDRSNGGFKWRPSIHMPRWASRLTLTVTDVRVQRLQEIREADAKAEGARPAFSYPGWDGVSSVPRYTWGFHELWNSLHGPDAWAANPWVVALTFTVQRGNIDQTGGGNV